MMPDCRFDWQYPSSGEKNFDNSMIPLIGLIDDSAQKETSTILCFFDEPDDTLHPLLKGHLQLVYQRCSKGLNKRIKQN